MKLKSKEFKHNFFKKISGKCLKNDYAYHRVVTADSYILLRCTVT